MNEDPRLLEAMADLEPSQRQVARCRVRVEERLERERRPLAAEWLDLVRHRPLGHGGLVLAAACALLLTSPLGSLLWAVLKAGKGG